MGQLQSSVNSRLIYENAKANLIAAQVSVATAVLTQSFLRVENQLLVAVTNYVFPFLNTQPNPTAGIIFNTEKRLVQQDSFVAASWGVFLSNPASNTDATAPLHSFPNPFLFGAAPAAAAETIYNSVFSLTVNNNVILPSWDAYRHRAVLQTQQIAVAPSSIDQSEGDSTGFYPVEPNLVIIGSKNSVLQLQLPAALAAVTAFERISVILRGVLAQNSTILT